MHVHLAAALADDAHDARVRNCGLDAQRLHVELLQLLRVLLLREDLDLQRVHLQQLCSLLQVIPPSFSLT